jgi:hypothetical protein
MGKEVEALIIALDERFATVIDESGLFPHMYQQYQNMSVTHRFCLHLSSGNYRSNFALPRCMVSRLKQDKRPKKQR